MKLTDEFVAWHP